MDISILSEGQEKKLRSILSESRKAVIVVHKSPDGDALGSSLAWWQYLVSLEIDATIIAPDAWPDFIAWLPLADKIVRYDKHKEECDAVIAQSDTVFYLDLNSIGRVESLQEALSAVNATQVMIDHHLEPTIPCHLSISLPKLSSTSEIVFRIIYQLGGYAEMSRLAATCIYTGMMTDTGAFTYNSTRAEIYHIIGLLLEKRIDKDRIYRRVYHNYSEYALRMRGYVISRKLRVVRGLHAAWFSITRDEMQRFHFIKGDAEGLVNEPLQIKGMKLSISLREDDRTENTIWVSVRSVDNFPANKMAEQFFNGGGHLNAAGGRLLCTMAEAEKTVEQAIQHFADALRQ